MFTEVRRTVKDSFAANEMNPIKFQDALNAIGCYPRDVVPMYPSVKRR